MLTEITYPLTPNAVSTNYDYTGVFDDKGDDPRDTDPPLIFGEEIDDNPLCCVRTFDAQSPDPAGDDVLVQGAVTIVRNGQREVNFTLQMGRPADAAKIKVIQYYKNESQRTPHGAVALVHTEPDSESWSWQPGSDGYAVDSLDNIRCWPDFSADDGQGVKRDPATGLVTWKDFPGANLQFYRNLIQTGGANVNDFPVIHSVEFKTDIICTDADLCQPDSPAIEALIRQETQDNLVARAVWKFAWGMLFSNNIPVITLNNIGVNFTERKVYNPCEESGPF